MREREREREEREREKEREREREREEERERENLTRARARARERERERENVESGSEGCAKKGRREGTAEQVRRLCVRAVGECASAVTLVYRTCSLAIECVLSANVHPLSRACLNVHTTVALLTVPTRHTTVGAVTRLSK